MGAVATGAGGVVLLLHEFRRKDRKATRAAMDTYSDELYSLGQAYVELRRYDFEVRKRLADAGIDTPPPPRREKVAE